MNKKTYFFLVALLMVFVFCGSSAVTAADPTNNTINGTITIKEYNVVKNLTNATVTVNNSGRILGTAKTDQNGYYSINFFSNQTKFNVTANFVGCNPITNQVNIVKGSGNDPNYYNTTNIQLTPKTITVSGTGNGTNVYIKYDSGYQFAGQIKITYNGNTYNAYCIDLYTPIAITDVLLVGGPLPGTVGDIPQNVDWAKVNYIVNHYDPSLNTTSDARKIEGAAIQCAIWYYTSVGYGLYSPSRPSSEYYQFMTYNKTLYGTPYDGHAQNYGDQVANRAWQIISQAQTMLYPYSVDMNPDSTQIGTGQSQNLTTIVKDQFGNPISGVTVNFTASTGTLNATSAVTDTLGTVKVSISGLTNGITALVTSSISGNYATLLYDDPLNPKQNLIAGSLLPFTISDTSYVTCNPKANVTLSQTVNSPVNVGDTVTYIVTANNRGPNAATNIVISDVIPASLANVIVTPSVGTYNSSTGLWIIPTLNNGASATLTITGKATVAMAGLNTTNNATRIAQDQYNAESNTTSAKVYTKKANVVLSEVVNSPVNVGGLVTYIVTALNNGPDNATNIVISDVLPAVLAGFTVTPSVGTYNSGVWSIPSLASGVSATLSIVGNATAAMAGFNTTNTATQTGQTEFSDLYTSANATVYTKLADTKLSQTVTTPVNVGGMVTYVVTITNTGPDTATNFIIQDNVPVGLVNYTVTPSTGTYLNGNWTIFSLANGESVNLTITGITTAAMAGKNTTNTATKITETEYDPTTIGESTEADAYTKEANVVLTQTGSYNKNNVTFIVTARNNGPDNATEVNIKDLIPNGLSNVIVTPSVGTYDIGTGIWYIPVLANGTSATLNITGTGVVQTTINNTANKTSQIEYDPNTPDTTNASVYVPSVNIAVYNTPWFWYDKINDYLYSYVKGNSPVFMWSAVNSLTRDEATGV
ncbi:MAG: Ig-like domain-containing protein, partial [Methanobacteriaceae archaeon]|nr:Ig-like domain-containing protein [Methanobacteriaceae archaeon]